MQGQSLIEILVAVGLGVILIGGVTALISVNLRTSSDSKTTQMATSLAQEVMDGAKSAAESDWEGFRGLGSGSANKYYIASSTYAITSGTESLVVGGYNFNRYFYIDSVRRTQCGVGSPTTNATTSSCNSNFPLGEGDIAQDPSTQKITAVVEWTGGKNVTQVQYVSRAKNATIRQSDWSGGGGDNSVLTAANNKYSTAVGIDANTTPGTIEAMLVSGASQATTTNISATDKWAWNDVIGWIDVGYSAGAAGINNAKMFGYASSSVGFIAFDCATTPNGDVCSGPAGNWGVVNVGGVLQGWAYNDSIGWISFDSVTAGSPTSYGVSIDPPTGELRGWAWNDAIGWISMNCVNAGTCGTINYKVKTSWVSVPDSGSLTSPIFDLGSDATLNAVIWKGITNGGTVRFQIAASALSTGPWNATDYKGPDGTSGTMYSSTGPDTSTMVSPRNFSNVRYMRYKIIIESNAGRTDSPEVRDIIVGYSL